MCGSAPIYKWLLSVFFCFGLGLNYDVATWFLFLLFLMVIAVLHNNARHLCIDRFTVASAIHEIATVRPELVAEIVFVAALIDSESAELYAETAQAVAPEYNEAIQQAVETAIIIREDFDTNVPTSQPSGESPPPEEETETEEPPETETELPPGGGVPSPE